MSSFTMHAVLLALCCSVSAFPISTHDVKVVNGHPGYLTAWAVSGAIDKVILIVAGFDTENDDHPKGKLQRGYSKLVKEVSPDGWDVIYFDYVDGSINLNKNADNLARFIEHLDARVGKPYHLAIVGGSMGGIVARTMFVNERSNMDVETYVTVDSPHHGVVLSHWVKDIAPFFVDTEAGHQMLYGRSEFNEHYGKLRRVEAESNFLPTIIDPMRTCALALSNGEAKRYNNGERVTGGGEGRQWKSAADDRTAHNRWYEMSSYVDAEGARSTYITYHSAVLMDSSSRNDHHKWYHTTRRYSYKNTASRYFDAKIPKRGGGTARHGAPEEIIRDAVEFVKDNSLSGGKLRL